MPDSSEFESEVTPTEVRDFAALKGLACAVILVVGTSLLLPVRYGSDDDVRFLLQLSGQDGFAAGDEIPQLSRLLSVCLCRLYDVLPSIPWYGIFVYATLLSGLTLFFRLLFVSIMDRGGRIIAGAAWAPLLLQMCLYPTLHSTCALLMLGVLLWLLLHATIDRPAATGKFFVFLCCLAAILIQPATALRYCLFAGPAIVFIHWPRFLRSLPFFIAALLFLGVDYYWRTAESSAAKNLEYENRLSLVHEFDEHARTIDEPPPIPALVSVHWTPLDYQSFAKTELRHDERFFNAASLTRFLGHELNEEATDPWLRFQAAMPDFAAQGWLFLAVFALAAVALFIYRAPMLGASNEHSIASVIIAICLLILPFGVMIFYHAPFAATIPVLAYVVGVLLTIRQDAPAPERAWNGNRPRFAARDIAYLLALIAAAGGGIMIQRDVKGLRIEEARSAMLTDAIQEVSRDTPKTLVLMRTDQNFHRHLLRPLHEELATSFKLLPGSDAIGSQRYERALQKFDYVRGSQLLTIGDSPNIVFVSFTSDRDDDGVVDLWQRYLLLHPDTSDDVSAKQLVPIAKYSDADLGTIQFLQLQDP